MNRFCHIQILKSEETVSNLTKLLDEQLQINESRMELRDLRDENEELLQKTDNNCEEFQARVFEIQNKHAAPSPYPPPRFLRSSDVEIHLGRGIWLPRIKFNEACNLNSTSLFVKMICDMLFTIEELKESTVTGKNSNRKQGVSRDPKKLDPTKVLAIKDITKYWLETLNYSEEAVDIEVGNVKRYIYAEISEYQRPLSEKRKYKRPNRNGKEKDDKEEGEEQDNPNSYNKKTEFDNELDSEDELHENEDLMDLDNLPSSETDGSILVDQQFDEESDFTSNPVEF